MRDLFIRLELLTKQKSFNSWDLYWYMNMEKKNFYLIWTVGYIFFNIIEWLLFDQSICDAIIHLIIQDFLAEEKMNMKIKWKKTKTKMQSLR